MATYRPDPQYYQKQIKAQEKLRKKFEQASYDSEKRGYVIDGQLYNETNRKANISNINAEIKRLKGEEKKFGKYGPDYGENVQPNEAGRQFDELLNKAKEIEVTDFDSALANLEAWKAVTDFAAANPGMVVVRRVDTTDGPMNARIDPFSNPGIKNQLENGLPSARDLALQEAETGVVETKTEYRGPSGAAAREVRVKTVTNQAELDRRLKAIDTAVEAPSRATRVQPTPTTTPTATTTTPTTTATTPTTTADRGTKQPTTTRPKFATPREFEMATTSPAPTREPKPSTGRGRRPGAGKVTTPKVVDWEPKFREMFPTQAWLLDLDRTKYADVFKLFQTAIDTRMYETQEGLQRFAAQLDNTSFYKELASTGKAREIRGLVGDLGFDTVPFNKFLTTAMNMGWEGDTLKQEAYKEAFRKDDTGQYVNPTAVKRVQASNDYLQVKNIGRAFFSDVNDSMVEQALTGGVTQDDIVRQQRELAKGKYAHLAPLLDQGLSLEDITASYRERAARLLEKDVNDIDMGSADFSQAFNFGEEGKKRMMGDGEWEILLRSDQRFGWRKTQNAKQEATQLASSIAQAFGRVL